MPKTTEEKIREIEDRSRRFRERMKNDPALRRRMLLATGAYRIDPVTDRLELKPELRPGGTPRVESTAAAVDAAG